MIRALAIALVLAACGSSKPAPAPAPAPAPMPPEMAKLRELLDTHAHASTDTCTALPDFDADADAIAKETPPVGANADTWTTATRQLVDAVAGLDAACKSSENIDAALQNVRASFDALKIAAKIQP
jgi:hypothetical protein